MSCTSPFLRNGAVPFELWKSISFCQNVGKFCTLLSVSKCSSRTYKNGWHDKTVSLTTKILWLVLSVPTLELCTCIKIITKPTQNQRFAGNFQQMIYGYLDIFLVSPQKRFVGTANASNEHHNIFFCGEIRKISIGFGWKKEPYLKLCI